MFGETPEIHSKWGVRVKGKIYQKINEFQRSARPGESPAQGLGIPQTLQLEN